MAEAATFNAQASLLLLLRQAGVLVGLAAAVALCWLLPSSSRMRV